MAAGRNSYSTTAASAPKQVGWALLLVLALALAACGTEGGAPDPDEGATGAPDVGDASEEPTAPSDDSEESYSLQFTTFVGPGNPTTVAFEWWAEQVEERTGGRVTAEPFYSQALLQGGETLEGVAAGRADLGHVGSAFYPDLALSMVVGVPFVTRNADAQARAFNQLYQENEDFRAEYEDRGVHVLFFPPNSPNIIGSQEPVASTEDLRNKQIRASGFIGEALQAVGANPIALPSPEIYESLQRGVIDAYSGFTFEYIVDFQLHEVAPHVMDSGLGNYVISPVVITKSLWDEMPEDIRSVLTQTSEEYMDVVIGELAELEDSVCDQILEGGGSVGVFPEDEIAEWREAVEDDIYQQWAGDVPGEVDADAFFAQYTDILEQAEAETEYVPGVERCASR